MPQCPRILGQEMKKGVKGYLQLATMVVLEVVDSAMGWGEPSIIVMWCWYDGQGNASHHSVRG